MGWKKKLDRARRLHRPSLRDWERDEFYKTFPAFVESVENAENFQALLLPGVSHPPSLPAVLDCRNINIDYFTETFEARGIPCVIMNVPEEENWPAVGRWDLEALENDPRLRNRYFKCGEDDDGKSIKVKLKYFMRYLQTNKDDSPLYVFDSGFDEDRDARTLLDDYKVPSFFRDDLFRLVSERRRPPYRWFLVGPERSGTCVHIDPLATSAWNTLICGKKRWVLFPPNVSKSVVKGRGLVLSGEDDEAIHYFTTILPRIKEKARQTGNRGEYDDFACYEFTQNAGETVFIPNGWWHAVLNLTHTVGVTQNFCSPRNFNNVWIKTRTGRKKMASKWLCQLDIHYPHLADRARAMNKRDRFVMKYNPEEVRRKDEERRRRSQMRGQKQSDASRKSFTSQSTSFKSDVRSESMASPSSVIDRNHQDIQRSRFVTSYS